VIKGYKLGLLIRLSLIQVQLEEPNLKALLLQSNRAFLCTGSTVCCGCRDAQERRSPTFTSVAAGGKPSLVCPLRACYSHGLFRSWQKSRSPARGVIQNKGSAEML